MLDNWLMKNVKIAEAKKGKIQNLTEEKRGVLNK